MAILEVSLVLLPDGSQRPIQNCLHGISVARVVGGRAEETDVQRNTLLMRSDAITIGFAGFTLTVTPEQEIAVNKNSTYRTAADLRVGNEIKCFLDSVVAMSFVDMILTKDEKVLVYDFHTANNFIVNGVVCR